MYSASFRASAFAIAASRFVVVIVLSSDAFTMFSSVAWNLYVTSLYPSAVSVMVQYPVPSVPSGSVQRRESVSPSWIPIALCIQLSAANFVP